VDDQNWGKPLTLKDRVVAGGENSTESRLRMQFNALVKDLEQQLGDFDPLVRASSLNKLARLEVPGQIPQENVNLHMHTFFSYNAEEWSPSRFAWEVRKAGLLSAGIIDFDGIDGIKEFLAAAESLRIRATAGIEIRTFLHEFADVEIDSPGEPGVHYIAGSGLVRLPEAGTPESVYLARLRRISDRRSRAMVDRINAAAPAIAIDYDEVVRTQTPGGYASERHFTSAYIDKAAANFPVAQDLARFWSDLLGKPVPDVLALLRTRPAFAETVRSKLMKKGGIGYLQPDSTAFPPTGEVYSWIKACGAIPMDSWLDGTSAGEARAIELMECNRSLGARALNLIPDRNWNVKDPVDKRRKLDNLARVISLASERHMPLHIGTEGNKTGLPFADELSGPELAPYKALFLDGAKVLVGHAILARFAEYDYCGSAAEGDFGADIRSKNAFFASVGSLPPLSSGLSRQLREMGPASALVALRASSVRGIWTGVDYH
jgi:hypothetical protein